MLTDDVAGVARLAGLTLVCYTGLAWDMWGDPDLAFFPNPLTFVQARVMNFGERPAAIILVLTLQVWPAWRG
jgi:hypothetical protein